MVAPKKRGRPRNPKEQTYTIALSNDDGAWICQCPELDLRCLIVGPRSAKQALGFFCQKIAEQFERAVRQKGRDWRAFVEEF